MFINMDRKFFLGANLPGRENTLGYEGTENQLIKQYGLKELNLIKGVSGNGKEILIRNVRNAFKEGDRDLYYCSGDAMSLDGVIFKDQKMGIIDATSPHIVDPIYHGLGIERIINLAEAIQTLNPKEALLLKEALDEFNLQRQAFCKMASKYLTIVRDEMNFNNKSSPDGIEDVYKQVVHTIREMGVEPCPERIHAFTRSFTGQGLIDLSKEMKGTRTIDLFAPPDVASIVYKRLNDEFGGYAFKHYLVPERFFEGVMLGDLIIKTHPLYEHPPRGYAVDCAIEALWNADCCTHHYIENLYSEYIDFSVVDEKSAELIGMKPILEA